MMFKSSCLLVELYQHCHRVLGHLNIWKYGGKVNGNRGKIAELKTNFCNTEVIQTSECNYITMNNQH